MQNKKPKLFTWYRIVIIIIIIALLIALIFPLVYNALSGESNEYTQGLSNLAIKQDQCISDTDCFANSYCYIGICKCINGWTGDTCDIPCPGAFTGNCSSNSNCTYDGNIRGKCYFGSCICDPGYIGVTCNLERRDVGTCFNDATCNNGQCIAVPPSFAYGECYCPENTFNWNCIPI